MEKGCRPRKGLPKVEVAFYVSRIERLKVENAALKAHAEAWQDVAATYYQQHFHNVNRPKCQACKEYDALAGKELS